MYLLVVACLFSVSIADHPTPPAIFYTSIMYAVDGLEVEAGSRCTRESLVCRCLQATMQTMFLPSTTSVFGMVQIGSLYPGLNPASPTSC